MKNQIIKLDEKDNKVFGFSDEQLIVSTKKHDSFSSLVTAINKSGMLETVRSIPMSSINEVMYNEKNESFEVKYDKNGKTKSMGFKLNDNTSREKIVKEIADVRGFNKSVLSESKTQPLLLNLLAIAFIGLATWVSRGMAIDAQQGGHFETSGRRSGIKQLLVNAVEAIGPTGVTIIGILAFLYMIYVAYRRYNNPASVFKYN